MLFAQLLDDFSSARRDVAENSGHSGLRNELVNHRLRKTIRISRERAFENDARHLPMTGRCIFAIRFERALPVTTTRLVDGRDARQRTNIAESETLKIRQIQLP